MWVIVYFDLPTETKQDRKLYTVFRKNLISAGFTMFQYSIYTRHCLSREYADRYIQGVKKILPPKGHIVISCITDKQFGMMEVYHGHTVKPIQSTKPMVELF
jgi:CRISPR-associated protein Cas2